MARTFKCTTAIAAPPEAVFAVLVDIDTWGQWLPNLVRVERAGSGPLQQGEHFRETRKMFGSESTEAFEVVELEAPRRLVLRVDGSKGTSGKGIFTFEHLVAAQGEGTLLTIRGSIDMPGFVAKLLGGLFMGMFKSAIAKDMEAMGRFAATRASGSGAA
ncbi:MAG: SRPBCC family protein [Deltaproteobacteria bacterium]|nr:SRPBCC family protein [Deltaproteobacteria bacterium]